MLWVNGSYNSPDSITKHLFLGNQRIGQVKKRHSENETTLILGDHLGSSSVLTDAQGNLSAIYDYYPYGDARIEEEIAGGTNKRFTGQELDKESELYYYGARYYEAGTGRFTQVDPVSLKIAISNEVQKITGQTQQQLLTNPQVLNSYAYTANNPVKYVDPDGNFFFLIPFILAIFTATVAALGSYATWQVGQSAGYAIEGNTAQSSAHTNKAMLAFAGIAAVGEGALAVMPLTVTNTSAKGRLIVGENSVSVSKRSNIRFTQTDIKRNFSSEKGVPKFFQNRSIDDVAVDIRADHSLVNQVKVNYVERDGYRLIDNTRSAVTLQKAGIDPSQWNWNKITNPNEINRINSRLSNNGLSSNGTTIIQY